MAVIKTVLQYVQSALSSTDSDAVDSIGDTEESMQYAEYLKDVYYELLNQKDWSFLNLPIALVSAGNVASPTEAAFKTEHRHVNWLEYNIADDPTEYQRKELKWVEPEEFVCLLAQPGDDRLLVTTGDQVRFYVTTNKWPTYWTSFDQQTVYLDAYDSSLESTITTSRLGGWGLVVPEFTVSDGFVPLLPVHLVPTLQHTFNAACSITFRQLDNPAESIRSIRQRAKSFRSDNKATKRDYYANKFGRVAPSGSTSFGRHRRGNDEQA